jgi:hypothetical protein
MLTAGYTDISSISFPSKWFGIGFAKYVWFPCFLQLVFLFLRFLGWGETESATVVYSTGSGWQIMVSMEQSVEWVTGETGVLGENLPVVRLCSPQILQYLTWVRTPAVVENRRLTNWAKARSFLQLSRHPYESERIINELNPAFKTFSPYSCFKYFSFPTLFVALHREMLRLPSSVSISGEDKIKFDAALRRLPLE